MKLVNDTTGAMIELVETDNITILENQLMLLGMNGLFYSQVARDIQIKINKLKENIK